MIGCDTAVLAALSGCGKPFLTTEDVIVTPGQPARFVVFLDREYMKASIEGAKVSFTVDHKPVGEAVTDRDGVASIEAVLDGGSNRYEAPAVIGNDQVRKIGRIFHWDASRTAVAIDVDETISWTDYGQLFLTALDTVSPALAHSPEAVRAMQTAYQIVYLSARPRWLHEKTRVWLKEHGFPPGPILHASKFEACMHQERYKRDMLAEFQRSYPNLLIGVGDKEVDDRAYGANRMLTIILGKPEEQYRAHCVVFEDWRGIERFFADHRDTLCDAGRLAATIQAHNMNLRPLFEQPAATLALSQAGPGRGFPAKSSATPPQADRELQSTPQARALQFQMESGEVQRLITAN